MNSRTALLIGMLGSQEDLGSHLTFDISAANSRGLKLFERGVKCGVEFCFFILHSCLGNASELQIVGQHVQCRIA